MSAHPVDDALRAVDDALREIAWLQAINRELLAACREFDDFVRLEEADGDDGVWTDEYRALVENVRAAIQKAEAKS